MKVVCNTENDLAVTVLMSILGDITSAAKDLERLHKETVLPPIKVLATQEVIGLGIAEEIISKHLFALMTKGE